MSSTSSPGGLSNGQTGSKAQRTRCHLRSRFITRSTLQIRTIARITTRIWKIHLSKLSVIDCALCKPPDWNSSFVAMAMQAHYHVKGISYLSCPETVILLVDNALKPFMPDQVPIWDKAKLIGCSGLLRGCAGTSVSRILQREREKVVGFLGGRA